MNILFALCFLLPTSRPDPPNKIVVQVANFENNRGACIVCLYADAASFAGKGAPVRCETVAITNRSASVVFENVAEGTYAVSVIHDANNNRKFDTNFMGIPKEGYGASRNKLPFAAAPRFDENKFVVTPNTVVTHAIRLRYIF